ncbi:MAG: hypothetical protein JSV13_00870 [Nitrospiraceae bacterium]|nr:MAG: hypothetical protein JSV13_00870 [Nitrospiraceae bacterium]
MLNRVEIIDEVSGFYRVIALNMFRRTPGVFFDNIPTKAFSRIDAIDRVIHMSNASSPGPVGSIERPWYMHPHQEDNLIVLSGTRFVELYDRKTRTIKQFTVTPELIKKEDRIIFDGAGMLCWPMAVFHRVISPESGSTALNFAVHHEGIDVRTNFNIYDVDIKTGAFRVVREAHLDQQKSE